MGIHSLTLIISWFEPVFPAGLLLDNKEVIYGKFCAQVLLRYRLNKTNYNIQLNILRKTNVKNPSLG